MKKVLMTFIMMVGLIIPALAERTETEVIKFQNGVKIGNTDTNVYTNMPSVANVATTTNNNIFSGTTGRIITLQNTNGAVDGTLLGEISIRGNPSSGDPTPTDTTKISVYKSGADGFVGASYSITMRDGGNHWHENFRINKDGRVYFGDVSDYDRISIFPVYYGGTNYDGTITSEDLTSARTWTLPNKSGTVAMTSDTTTLPYTFTNALVIDNLSTTNFILDISHSAINLQYGRLWVTNPVAFSRTCNLRWYDYGDYRDSNLYWNANVSFVVVTLTNGAAAGANIVGVSDASGFSTNNLIWFGVSNEFERISAITGNTVYIESPLLYGQANNATVSKVVEFGGFPMSDTSISNKLYGRISSTNAFTATINGIFKYIR